MTSPRTVRNNRFIGENILSHSISGSALVSTLLVLVVLTIIVLAFLQSMTLERQTARSYLNRYKAELAANSGANEAVDLLLRSDSECLVNAYAEDTANYQGSSYTAPYLTTLKLDPNARTIAETRYLCSSVSADSSQVGTNFWRSPSAASAAGDETTDINAKTSSFPEGFIGLADEDGSRRTIPVPWHEMLKDPNLPRDDDRTSPTYNPVIGRYAYWIDDESAKVNLPTAGSVDSNGGHLRQAGRKPSEIAVHPIFAKDAASAGSDVNSFVTQRDAIEAITEASPAFPPSSFRHLSSGLSDSDLWQDRRAFVTSWSEADERGPVGGVPDLPGIRKLNLNEFVKKANNYRTQQGRGEIARNVVALGDYINMILPEFGNRASNDANLPDSVKRRYCVQIAANIQDYIDEDSQPTVIRQDLDSPQWEEPPDPGGIGEGAPTQPPAAFGKENVPSVTEYLGYYYNENGALRIDHTFEVLNIYTKDIILDPSTWGTVQVFLAQRPPITPNGASNAPVPDLIDPLVFAIPANTILPRGRYSQLTSLPPSSTYRGDWVATGAAWTPLNWVDLPRGEGTFAFGSDGLRMEGDGTAQAADADTEIVVANEYGYLDIQPRVAQQGPVTFTSPRKIASQVFGNDGTSTGNNMKRKYPLDSGDPRSATDIFPTYNESIGSISTMAWRRNTANSKNATILGGDSNGGTYGFIPNNQGSDITGHVPEPLFGENPSSLVRATSVLRDGDMATIGELGFIYDPALPGEGNPDGTWRRGGFRTLSIGTRYGEISAAGNGGSAENPLNLPQTVDSTGDNSGKRAYRLMDIFDVSDDRRGRILVNSALRDPRNIPLRSVFHNLKTQDNTADDIQQATYSEYAGPADPKIPAKSATNVDAVIQELTAAAKSDQKGPFLSLGQIGDLDIFNKGNALYGSPLDPNSTNTAFYDRGREEILRNSFQLLTLKGSVYTIYVVAQSGDTVKDKFVPRSTIRLIRTVKLERRYPAESLASIDPDDLKTNNTPTLGETTASEIFREFY